MLPLHSQSDKMNRHAHHRSPSPNGYSYPPRANTMGESGRGFNIRPDKYDKYVLAHREYTVDGIAS